MMGRSLCGEMTVHIRREAEPAAELQMIAAVAREMNLSSSVEVAELREVLFPCLICSAVYKNNFDIRHQQQSMPYLLQGTGGPISG